MGAIMLIDWVAYGLLLDAFINQFVYYLLVHPMILTLRRNNHGLPYLLYEQVQYSLIFEPQYYYNLEFSSDHDNDDDDAADNNNDITTITTITITILPYGQDWRILKGITMMMIVLLMKVCIESSRDNSFVFFLFWIATEGS